MTLAVIVPGPDFAIVTQNTLLYSRKKGVYTGLGVALSNLFHTSYCLLGLTVIISKSLIAFSVIKLLGAAYLIYLGIKALRMDTTVNHSMDSESPSKLSNAKAVSQGFLCNALNPKAALLFLSIFTVFVTPETSLWMKIGLGIELTLINLLWYTLVSAILTLGAVKNALTRFQTIMTKAMGSIFIIFGVKLATIQR